jgi:hypothetical protein
MDFWRVKSSGCDNSPKKASLNVTAAENPKLSGFTIQMSLGVFKSKISHRNESRKILIFAAFMFFRLFFGMKFYMPKMLTCNTFIKEVK